MKTPENLHDLIVAAALAHAAYLDAAARADGVGAARAAYLDAADAVADAAAALAMESK